MPQVAKIGRASCGCNCHESTATDHVSASGLASPESLSFAEVEAQIERCQSRLESLYRIEKLGAGLSACQCICHRVDFSADGHDVAPSDPKSRALRASLDRTGDEIQDCLTHLTALRRWRNDFFPVFRLPPELLAEIFGLCAQHPRLSSVRDRKLWLEPFRLSQVCHLWRQVALGHPGLWTYPFFSSLRLARTMLARTKDLPIHVRAEILSNSDTLADFCQDYSALYDALEKARPIASLHLESCHSAFMDYVLPSLSPSATSNLESLMLRIHDSSDAIVPDTLHDTAPRLRILYLHSCAVPWLSPILHNISDLRLNLMDDSKISYQPTWEDMCVGLEGMSSLHTLLLTYALPREYSASSDRRQIKLPNLKILHISDELPTTDAFLKSIVASPDLCLDIAAFPNGADPTGETMISIFSTLKTFLRAMGPDAPSSLYLRTVKWTSSLRVWSTVDMHTRPRLAIVFGHNEDTLLCGLGRLIDLSWSSHVQKLLTEGAHDHFTETDWGALLPMIPAVVAVTSVGSIWKSFLAALASNAAAVSLTELLSLPDLRSITLEDSRHVKSHPEGPAAASAAFGPRAALGTTLKELHLVRWGSVVNGAPVLGIAQVMLDDRDPDIAVRVRRSYPEELDMQI